MTGPEATVGNAHSTKSSWGVFDYNHNAGANTRPMTMDEKLQKNSIHVQAAASQSAGAYMG